MKRKFGFVFLLALVMTAACSRNDVSSSNSGPDKQSLPTPASTGNTVASDSRPSNAASTQQDPFWAEAVQGGMLEVELGQLASGKAQNAEVKRFAEMMVADHGKANQELKTTATAQGITLPAALSPEHQTQIVKLQGLSGAEFDKAYVDAMVAAHEKDVAAFRDRSQTATDPELKAFASKTLPTLEKHLELIRGIRTKIQ